MTHSIIGRSTIGSICFGVRSVSGRRRVPNPPTRTTAFTARLSWCCSGAVRGGVVRGGARGRSTRELRRCCSRCRRRGRRRRRRRRRRRDIGHLGDAIRDVGLRRDRRVLRHERDRERLVRAEADLVETVGEDLVRLVALGRVGGVIPLRHLEHAVLAALALGGAFLEGVPGEEGERVVGHRDADLIEEHAEGGLAAGGAVGERVDVDQAVAVGVDAERVGLPVRRAAPAGTRRARRWGWPAWWPSATSSTSSTWWSSRSAPCCHPPTSSQWSSSWSWWPTCRPRTCRCRSTSARGPCSPSGKASALRFSRANTTSSNPTTRTSPMATGNPSARRCPARRLPPARAARATFLAEDALPMGAKD